jgi:site-specific recombinase XerD
MIISRQPRTEKIGAGISPPEIIREFLRYLRVEKNASPLTLAAYRSDIRPLEEFLYL